jgi:ribonuclease HI
MPVKQEEPLGSFFLGSEDDEAGTWLAHCDGGAWPNPGAMALGAVIISPAGSVHQLSQRLVGIGCNNEAEWRATLAVLKFALQQGAQDLRLHTDSTQVRDHLTQPGAHALPPALQAWANEARTHAANLRRFDVQWVPRHRNSQADALAREALGLLPKPAQTPHPKRRRRA